MILNIVLYHRKTVFTKHSIINVLFGLSSISSYEKVSEQEKLFTVLILFKKRSLKH